jgi:hypothetical protein
MTEGTGKRSTPTHRGVIVKQASAFWLRGKKKDKRHLSPREPSRLFLLLGYETLSSHQLDQLIDKKDIQCSSEELLCCYFILALRLID